MKRVLWFSLFSMVSVALLGSAAFGAEGPYMSIQAGATWLEDADVDYTGLPIAVESEFDTGFNVGAAFGYGFGMGRLEGEIAYRENDFDEIGGLEEELLIFGSVDADGDVSALSFMANGFFDIENPSPVTPYLGAGAGIANVSVNDLEFLGVRTDDDDTVFAYQLSAGIGFEVTGTTTMDLSYRYFATEDPEFTDDDGDEFESEYNSHNLSLGFRFAF